MFQPLAPMPLAQLSPDVPTTISSAPAPAPAAPSAVLAPAPVVATAATTSQPSTTQPDAPIKPSPLSSFLGTVGPIVLMIAVLYFVLFRGPKKEEKKRKAMINEIKKGDTVMTIGGLIARVVSVDGDNIVLKIDESANVKATYTKRSIQQVLSDDDKAK